VESRNDGSEVRGPSVLVLFVPSCGKSALRRSEVSVSEWRSGGTWSPVRWRSGLRVRWKRSSPCPSCLCGSIPAVTVIDGIGGRRGKRQGASGPFSALCFHSCRLGAVTGGRPRAGWKAGGTTDIRRLTSAPHFSFLLSVFCFSPHGARETAEGHWSRVRRLTLIRSGHYPWISVASVVDSPRTLLLRGWHGLPSV